MHRLAVLAVIAVFVLGYSHLSPEHLQGAVAVIDRAMNQTGDQPTQFSGAVAVCSPLEGTTSSATA